MKILKSLIVTSSLLFVAICFADKTALSGGDGGASATGGKFQFDPIAGANTCITSKYGPRMLNGSADFHSGWDFKAPVGTTIQAMGDGKITATGFTQMCGKYVEIKFHSPAVYAHFCHLKSLKSGITVGQTVTGGEALGQTDTTGHAFGPHLHFVIKGAPGMSDLKNANGITMDPAHYLPSTPAC